MPITQTDIAALTPKTISRRHFLSKAATKAAKNFSLGGQDLALDLDTKAPRFALVKEFEVHPGAASRLNRTSNVVETVAVPIEHASGTDKALRTYMKKVKVPKAVAEKSALFHVSVRRRTPAASRGNGAVANRGPTATRGGGVAATRVAGVHALTREVSIAAEQHFVLGFTTDAKKNLVATVIHPDYRLAGALKKGGVTLVKIPPVSDTDGSQAAPVPTEQEDPDNTQDFAQCYATCLTKIPEFLLTLAGAVCGTCAATIAAAAGTAGGGGVTAAAVAVACGACAVTVGVIMGNCLLTCHEML